MTKRDPIIPLPPPNLQRNNDNKKEACAEENAFKFVVPRAIKIFLRFFLSTDNQLMELSSQRYNVFN